MPPPARLCRHELDAAPFHYAITLMPRCFAMPAIAAITLPFRAFMMMLPPFSSLFHFSPSAADS